MKRYTRAEGTRDAEGAWHLDRIRVWLCHTEAAERKAERRGFYHQSMQRYPALIKSCKRDGVEVVIEEKA